MTNFQELIASYQNCACGVEHRCDIQDILVGSGLVHQVGAILQENHFPRKLLLVADRNTLQAADGTLLDTITSATFDSAVINLAGAFPDGGTETTIDLTIQYKDEPTSARTLALRVINGAVNVASADEWEKETTATKIAVLKGFEINIPYYETGYIIKRQDTSKTSTESQKYVKDISNGGIYGNFQKIAVTGHFKIFTGQSHNFIKVAGGSIEQLILVGPDYGDKVSVSGSIHTPLYGTYVSAIGASGGANIVDSFVSGFRSPVSASGTVTIKNTTLNKGNYANLFVGSKAILILENVTTIQYHGADDNIGAGIVYNYNSGQQHKITAVNLKQHNWVTQTDIENIVKSAGSVAGGLIKIEPEYYDSISQICHKIDGKDYYNIGIFELDMNIGSTTGTPAVDVSGLISNFGYDGENRVHAPVGDGYAGFNLTAPVFCGEGKCEHALPTTNVEDHITYFTTNFNG